MIITVIVTLKLESLAVAGCHCSGPHWQAAANSGPGDRSTVIRLSRRRAESLSDSDPHPSESVYRGNFKSQRT